MSYNLKKKSEVYYTVNFCNSVIANSMKRIAELRGLEEDTFIKQAICSLYGMPFGILAEARCFGKIVYANDLALFLLGHMSIEDFKSKYKRYKAHDKAVFYPQPKLLTS